MVVLALALVLTQVPVPENAPSTPQPLEQLPPEARVTPPPAQPQLSGAGRSLLSGGIGALGGGVALGVTALLTFQNPGFDVTFPIAGLGAILITGLAFTIHEVFGGRGEIVLGFLLAAVVMAGATAAAYAIDQRREATAYLAVAIGSVPAAAAAVLGLEGTSPATRPARTSTASVGAAFTGTGVVGWF